MTHPIVDNLPAPARSAVQGAWQRLGPDQRRNLEQWLPGAGNISGVRDILQYITENYRAALDQTRATIAIVGPANVGKSTLYNQLIMPKEAKARVSPVPGTTRVNQDGLGGTVQRRGHAGRRPARRDRRSGAGPRLRSRSLSRLPDSHVRCRKRRQKIGARAFRRHPGAGQALPRGPEQDGPGAEGRPGERAGLRRRKPGDRPRQDHRCLRRRRATTSAASSSRSPRPSRGC